MFSDQLKYIVLNNALDSDSEVGIPSSSGRPRERRSLGRSAWRGSDLGLLELSNTTRIIQDEGKIHLLEVGHYRHEGSPEISPGRHLLGEVVWIASSSASPYLLLQFVSFAHLATRQRRLWQARRIRRRDKPFLIKKRNGYISFVCCYLSNYACFVFCSEQPKSKTSTMLNSFWCQEE